MTIGLAGPSRRDLTRRSGKRKLFFAGGIAQLFHPFALNVFAAARLRVPGTRAQRSDEKAPLLRARHRSSPSPTSSARYATLCCSRML